MSRFLERWSRLKKAAESASTAEAIDPEKLLANLGPESDFTVFLKEEVCEVVRRQAMKTLFADPRFNVMDGLDIYIDDYSVSDPIPPEMMATLNHARTLFGDPETEAESTAAQPAAPEGLAEAAATSPGGETELPEIAANRCDILSADGQNVPATALSGADELPGSKP